MEWTVCSCGERKAQAGAFSLAQDGNSVISSASRTALRNIFNATFFSLLIFSVKSDNAYSHKPFLFRGGGVRNSRKNDFEVVFP